MSLDFDHNVEEVIGDIQDVQTELHSQLRRRVGSAMRVVQRDTAHYIIGDPHASGDLFRSLQYDDGTSEMGKLYWSVGMRRDLAPYAAITEYGSGQRTGLPGPGSKPLTDSMDSKPPDYPFSAPSIDNISGFAYYIEQWMREKGLEPEHGSLRQSALAIAKTIDEKGTYQHPYLRPAWFDNELDVRRAARTAVTKAVN